MERRIIRQGDVILVPVDDLAVGATVPREEGRIVLAHGEVTGHAHAIEDERAQLVTPDGAGLASVDEADVLYLLVRGSDPVDLVHEEHATISVPPGDYEVRRLREYQPDASGWVSD